MLNEMENKSKFLKIGDKVVYKKKTEGLEYDLEPNIVYTVDVDRWSDEVTLTKTTTLALPTKVYTTEQDDKFVNKVIDCFHNRTDYTLGVMLSGLKGSGKSVEAKIIANKSNLPIIAVDKYLKPHVLKKLFDMFEGLEVCYLFDEIDKIGENYDDDYLLQLLDGINTKSKSLFLFTANDTSNINEYLKNRCSRIRYWREFDTMSELMIKTVLEDKLNNKDNIDDIVYFIKKRFDCISFDNVCSFIDEINAYPDSSFEDLFNDMNLSKK